MAENTEPQSENTEVEEAEVEAHAASVLPLQGLGTPDADGLEAASKSTASIVC